MNFLNAIKGLKTKKEQKTTQQQGSENILAEIQHKETEPNSLLQLPDISRLPPLPELPTLQPLDLPPEPPKQAINQNTELNKPRIPEKIGPVPKAIFPLQEHETEISTAQVLQQMHPPPMRPLLQKPQILELPKIDQTLTAIRTITIPPMPSLPITKTEKKAEILAEPITKPIQKPIPRPTIRPEQIAFEKEYARERSSERTKPVFVKIIQYNDLFSNINEIKKITLESEQYGMKAHEISIKKSKMLMRWQDQLEDIQRMLITLDKSIFEKEDSEYA